MKENGLFIAWKSNLVALLSEFWLLIDSCFEINEGFNVLILHSLGWLDPWVRHFGGKGIEEKLESIFSWNSIKETAHRFVF